MTIIFTDQFVAAPTMITGDTSLVYVDPLKAYGTEYGLFIPSGFIAEAWIKWIKAGMPEMLEIDYPMAASCVHVTNTGDVYTVSFNDNGEIHQLPHTSSKIGTCSSNGLYFISLAAVVEKCETITQALDVLEEKSIFPAAIPRIIAVDDWVEYAKEKGYNKPFLKMRFKK